MKPDAQIFIEGITELAWKRYEIPLASLYRTMPSFALMGFIAGTALTELLDQRWPRSSRFLLVAAAVASLINMLYSYEHMRRSKKAYKESLEALRAVDPKLAAELERNLR